jgi:hypothetical protein
MNCKGCRRKHSWPDWGPIQIFAWRDQGKPWKTCTQLVVLQAKTWSGIFLNTKQEWLRWLWRISSSGMWHRVDPQVRNQREQVAAVCSWFLARRFFYPEDGGDAFLRNVGSHTIYMVPHPRRRHSSGVTTVWPLCFMLCIPRSLFYKHLWCLSKPRFNWSCFYTATWLINGFLTHHKNSCGINANGKRALTLVLDGGSKSTSNASSF